jgi:hypothetical protein
MILFIIVVAGVIARPAVGLVLGRMALNKCEPEDVPETLRAASRFVGHPDPPVQRLGSERRRLGPGTGPPRRQDSRLPPRGRTAMRKGRHRRVRR